jgi:hypothetical protein
LASIASSEPASSPMETICTTMLGKSWLSRMATCSCVPVETSSRIFMVAS